MSSSQQQQKKKKSSASSITRKKQHSRTILSSSQSSSSYHHHQPPARLAWPCGGTGGGSEGSIGHIAPLFTQPLGSQSSNVFLSQQSQSSTTQVVAAARRSKSNAIIKGNNDNIKRQRIHHHHKNTTSVVASLKTSHNDDDYKESMLWIDKYAPTNNIKELCVQPKKIKEVRLWLETALGMNNNNNNNKLLILVGSPGIGKSTMIRVLASDMNLSINEWNDMSSGGFIGGRQQTRGDYDYYDPVMSVDNTSSIQSFEQFLQSSGTGYNSLSLQNQQQQQVQVTSTTTTTKERNNKKKIQNNKSSSSSSSAGGGNYSSNKKSIILLEDLPNLYNYDAQVQFRSIMSQHLEQSVVPTVLIFSDVSEGKCKPSDLERLIDVKYLHSPTGIVRINSINAVTKQIMKRILTNILKCENRSHIIPKDKSEANEFWDEICLQSSGSGKGGGDLRNAIMSLQYQYGYNNTAGNSNKRKRGNNNATKTTTSTTTTKGRDKKLSTFHALGKLLYAKRKQQQQQQQQQSIASSWNNNNDNFNSNNNRDCHCRPPIDFDPELVVEQSDIGHSSALSFLQYHSPDFFTDIEDLSKTYEYYSDASMLLDQSPFEIRDSIFPKGYVSSLAGRAVAHTNLHPAPSKFKQFTSPGIFDVLKKSRNNSISMKQLCKRLSSSISSHEITTDMASSTSCALTLDTNLGSIKTFVTDSFPFMRTILPVEVNSALDNLYSFVRPGGDNNKSQQEQPQQDEAIKMAIEQQQQILSIDDIVDDDDDDNDHETYTSRSSSSSSIVKQNSIANVSTAGSFVPPQQQSQHNTSDERNDDLNRKKYYLTVEKNAVAAATTTKEDDSVVNNNTCSTFNSRTMSSSTSTYGQSTTTTPKEQPSSTNNGYSQVDV